MGNKVWPIQNRSAIDVSLNTLMVGFKIQSATVLFYLEFQYQRNVAASANLTTFIKDQERQHGIFNVDVRHTLHSYESPQKDMVIVLVLLDKYEEALTALDLPFGSEMDSSIARE